MTLNCEEGCIADLFSPDEYYNSVGIHIVGDTSCSVLDFISISKNILLDILLVVRRSYKDNNIQLDEADYYYYQYNISGTYHIVIRAEQNILWPIYLIKDYFNRRTVLYNLSYASVDNVGVLLSLNKKTPRQSRYNKSIFI